MMASFEEINPVQQAFYSFLDEWKELRLVRKTYIEVCEIFAENLFFLNCPIKHRGEWFDQWKKLHGEDDRKLQELEKSELAQKMQTLLKLSNSQSSESSFEQASKLWEQDSEISRLSKVDQLEFFVNYVYSLARDEDLQRSEEQKTRVKDSRICRHKFKLLLEQLVRDGKLTSKSKWKQIYPLISCDERYLNLLKQPSTLPIVLFWDQVCLLKDQQPVVQQEASESELEEGEL